MNALDSARLDLGQALTLLRGRYGNVPAAIAALESAEATLTELGWQLADDAWANVQLGTDPEPSALEMEEMHALCDAYRPLTEDEAPF